MQILIRENEKLKAELAKTEAENKRLKDFIQQELDSMRKLVAELEKDPPMRSFTQVLKGRIARYRTVLAKP